MNTSPLRVERRAGGIDRRRAPVAPNTPAGWLDIAEAGILYFGITLSPVLIAILLCQLGVIA
jgi:hypothetical protein